MCDAYREQFPGKDVGSCNLGSLWLLSTVKSCLQMEHHTSWVGRAYSIEAACTGEAHVHRHKKVGTGEFYSSFHGWGGVTRQPFKMEAQSSLVLSRHRAASEQWNVPLSSSQKAPHPSPTSWQWEHLPFSVPAASPSLSFVSVGLSSRSF